MLGEEMSRALWDKGENAELPSSLKFDRVGSANVVPAAPTTPSMLMKEELIRLMRALVACGCSRAVEVAAEANQAELASILPFVDASESPLYAAALVGDVEGRNDVY